MPRHGPHLPPLQTEEPARLLQHARRIARRARNAGRETDFSLQERRLMLAADVLAAPKASVRAMLLAATRPDLPRRGLRLTGAFAPDQGILNAGALLHWRLQSRDQTTQSAAFEKLFLRPSGGTLARNRQDWMTEARALAGIRPTVAHPRCHLPVLLGLRRHRQAIGLVIGDLRLEGFREATLEQAVTSVPAITQALAALVTDFSAHPPFACRQVTLPSCRPFFATLTPARIMRIGTALTQCGISQRQARQTCHQLGQLDQSWERQIVASGLPWRIAHGDPYFRNLLLDADRVALVDLEKAVIGPLGLDIGRFIGTTLMRSTEARAQACHDGTPLARDLARLGTRKALETLSQTAFQHYLTQLQCNGLCVDPDALWRIARLSALMGLCYGSSVLLSASMKCPRATAPLARLLINWTEAAMQAPAGQISS